MDVCIVIIVIIIVVETPPIPIETRPACSLYVKSAYLGHDFHVLQCDTHVRSLLSQGLLPCVFRTVLEGKI